MKICDKSTLIMSAVAYFKFFRNCAEVSMLELSHTTSHTEALPESFQ